MKKIIKNNFILIYFVLLNIVLAIKMTTKYNDSLSEYFVFGFMGYGSILLFCEEIIIKKINIISIGISVILLLLLNYKFYITNTFIIKSFLFLTILNLLICLWSFLSNKYYKKARHYVSLKHPDTIKADVSILDFIFSILCWGYVIFGYFLFFN